MYVPPKILFAKSGAWFIVFSDWVLTRLSQAELLSGKLCWKNSVPRGYCGSEVLLSFVAVSQE